MGVAEPVADVESGCVVGVVCVDAEEVLAEEAVVLEGTVLVDAVPVLVPASVLCTGCFVVGDAASSVNYYFISYYILLSTYFEGSILYYHSVKGATTISLTICLLI